MRLLSGSKGNTTRQRGPLGLAVALSVPTLVCNIYYLRLQTYVCGDSVHGHAIR
jgi:hypothetical protein